MSAGADELLRRALRHAGLSDEIGATRALSGGCIHDVVRVELADGTSVVAKRGGTGDAAAFRAETAGLKAICATETVRTPQPLGVFEGEGACVLLMEHLRPGRGGDDAWRRFGRALASMHRASCGDRYGFETDNFLGPTPQPNGWMEDWVEFNATRRLGHQVDLAAERDLLRREEIDLMRGAIDALPGVLPRRPHPSLLHGDLWSGNALATEDGVAVLDPAVSIGDGWADVAMMRLFGGFPDACFEGYRSAGPPGGSDVALARIAAYQLYHVLNHVNIFGRGYAGQACRLAESIVRASVK